MREQELELDSSLFHRPGISANESMLW